MVCDYRRRRPDDQHRLQQRKVIIEHRPPVVTDPGTPLGTQTFTITAAGSDGVNSVRHIYQDKVTIQ